MCLNVDTVKTERHSEIKKNKRMIFWKKFQIQSSGIYTYFQNSPLKLDEKGFITAKGKLSINDNRIEGGCIHAYINAAAYVSRNPNVIVLPIIVQSDDVVAFGYNNDVCFFKYKLSKESWKKIKIAIKSQQTTGCYYKTNMHRLVI